MTGVINNSQVEVQWYENISLVTDTGDFLNYGNGTLFINETSNGTVNIFGSFRYGRYFVVM